jgi:Tol biopolymer transport system component
MNMDGTGVTQVSTLSGQHNYFEVVDNNVYSIWSTPGNSNGSAIYRSPLDFSTNTAISTVEYCMFLDAAPDGATCLRSKRDIAGSGTLPQNVYILQSDGSGETKLTTCAGTTEWAGYARYSPDGTKVMYTKGTQAPAQSDLYSINSNGTGDTRITNTASFDEWICDWR